MITLKKPPDQQRQIADPEARLLARTYALILAWGNDQANVGALPNETAPAEPFAGDTANAEIALSMVDCDNPSTPEQHKCKPEMAFILSWGHDNQANHAKNVIVLSDVDKLENDDVASEPADR